MPQPHFSIAPGSAPVPPVYFDAYPLSDPHLTGIGRYAARLALAMASIRPVRFFKRDRVVTPPADLDRQPPGRPPHQRLPARDHDHVIDGIGRVPATGGAFSARHEPADLALRLRR